MQTDIWLTEDIDHSERCPLCSQPLKKGSTTCFSCGFSTKFPTGTSVWFDPAVNGFPLSSPQRQSYQISQEARWRYARELPGTRGHPNPDTPVPPQNIDHSTTTSRSLVHVNYQHDRTSFYRNDQNSINILLSQEVDATSWTAGKAYKASHAQLISSQGRRKHLHLPVSLNPIDRVRWWLLRPGHIEFVFWLGGTVLLVAVTSMLLLITAFSFEWVTPGTSIGSGQQSTVVATSEMVLIRIDRGPILPGQSIGLRGQGFTPHAHLRFLFDGVLQLFDQNGHATSTQANAQGVFTTSVVVDSNLPWRPGPHFINAQDLTTKRMATLHIILSPAPISKNIPSTPVPSSPPALTPIPSVTSIQPTPVGQTPVPLTPTPHPLTPTPSPTLGKTPTVTSTAGTSPTANPTVRTTTVGSGLGNALNHPGNTNLGKQLTNLSPWVWLMIACYCLSMVLLGLAGVLHKRHQ